MTKSSFGTGSKSLYVNPLAEEIVVFFEENFLTGTNGEPASLSGWQTGGIGSSGYNGDAFDSKDNHHTL